MLRLFHRLPRWTFLVVDDHGKIFTFRHVQIWIIGLALLLLASLVVNAVLSVLYWQSEDESRHLRGDLQEATVGVESARNEKDAMMARMAMAVARAEAEEAPLKPPGEDPPSTTEAIAGDGGSMSSVGGSESGSQAGEASPAGEGTKETPVEDAGAVLEDVSFAVHQGQQALQARFKIRNNLPASRYLEGYIFVIFKPEAENSGRWVVSPTVPIDSGLPVQIEKGKYFKILNYKTLRFTARTDGDPMAYTKATVMVFADDHTPLLEKTFSVNG